MVGNQTLANLPSQFKAPVVRLSECMRISAAPVRYRVLLFDGESELLALLLQAQTADATLSQTLTVRASVGQPLGKWPQALGNVVVLGERPCACS